MKQKLDYLMITLLAVGSIALASCKKESLPTDQAYDYSKAENWMCCPQNGTHEVDVFYLFGTEIMNGTDTCMDLSAEEKESVKEVVLEGPGAFSDFANIFVPYYRQIPLNIAFSFPSSEDYLAAIRSNMGKKDVFAALDYYFEHCNNGRPFILAGHSQGSAMLRIVLDEYMAQHKEYYNRMIAAYVLGFAIPQTWLASNPHIKPATDECQSGVIIGWNTEGPGATKPNALLSGEDYLINPLNWKTTTEYAGAELNLGVFEYDDDTRTNYHIIVPGTADAQIDSVRHSLICTTCQDYVPFESMGEKSLHGKDWALYHKNIGENGRKRSATFLGHEPK